MKNVFTVLRSKGAKVFAAASAMAVSASSFAVDTASDTAIKAAQEAGKTSVQLTATGMIQIVAVIVGVGLVVSLLKRI